MTSVQGRRVAQWLKTLRSNKFSQSKHALRRGKNGVFGYCCLGVACELYGQEHNVPWTPAEQNTFRFMEQKAYLPSSVRTWLGLKDEHIKIGKYSDRPEHILALLNDDDDKSFAEIADFIEKNKKHLFVQKETVSATSK